MASKRDHPLQKEADNMKDMLTQKDKLIQDLFSLVETLETDLKEAYEELERKGPAAPPSSNAQGPASSVAFSQDYEYNRNGVIEEDKEDGIGSRGPRQQPDNEYSAELKAYLDEFKRALDDKNNVIKNEL